MKWPTHISNYRFNWSLDPTNLIHSKWRNLFNTHRNRIQCAPFRTNKLHVIELNGDRFTENRPESNTNTAGCHHHHLRIFCALHSICAPNTLRSTYRHTVVVPYTQNFLAKLFSFIECDPFRMTFSDWKSNGKFIGAVKWCH